MHPWFNGWYPRICQWLIAGWYLAGESSQLRGFGMFILWIWWFRSTSKPSSNTKPGGQALVGCRVHQVLTNVQRGRGIFLHMFDYLKWNWPTYVTSTKSPETLSTKAQKIPKGQLSGNQWKRPEEICNGIFSCETCCFSNNVWVYAWKSFRKLPKKHGKERLLFL